MRAVLPREFRHPATVVMLGLYVALLASRTLWHYPVPAVVNSYLADLLCLPLLLPWARFLLRKMCLIPSGFVLPDAWIFSTWLSTSLFFEGLLPLVKSSAVADPLDVVAYALGAVAYRRWFNRPA